MSILLIFLFSIVYNNIIVTVQSSIEDTQTITKSNPDITSNFTNVQWKKFVNDTIGISLEYPSHWEGGTGREGFYLISPKPEDFPSGEYPSGTDFRFFYGMKPPFDNLEVLTRVIAVDVVVERSSEDTDYHLIEKPTMKKYNLDGERTGAFSYRTIHDYPGYDIPDFIMNVEEIILIHEGKVFDFQFSYKEDAFDKDYINQIKDHMLKSIKWLHKEKNDEDIHS